MLHLGLFPWSAPRTGPRSNLTTVTSRVPGAESAFGFLAGKCAGAVIDLARRGTLPHQEGVPHTELAHLRVFFGA